MVTLKRGMVKICTMVAILIVGLFRMAYADELQEIKEAIRIKEARWVAGKTGVSELPDTLRKARLGTLIPEEKGDAPQYVPKQAMLPLGFDWKESGMVSSVKDQADCGSCWAFSTIAALESVTLIENSTTIPPDYSEQFLVSYNRSNSGCRGGYLNRAANFLRRVGVPTEDCLPYRANGRLFPPPCSTWSDETTHLVSWSWVDSNVDTMKAAVYENPVPTTYVVYRDFYYYRSGVYEHVWGKEEGGHSVLIVGWDDTEQCFIVKNSWGEEWGENGYFRIGYSQVSNEVKFGQSTVDFDGVW